MRRLVVAIAGFGILVPMLPAHAAPVATTLTLRVQRIITAGEQARLDGMLVDANGEPVVDGVVTVTAKPTVNNGTTSTNTVHTDEFGAFHITPVPEVSTIYEAAYKANSSYGASSTRAGQAVRVRLTARLQRNGRHIAVVGNTTPLKSGSKVALYEIRDPRRRPVFLGGVATVDAEGRFASHYYFRTGCGHSVFAHMGDTAGNLAGNSPVLAVNLCPMP